MRLVYDHRDGTTEFFANCTDWQIRAGQPVGWHSNFTEKYARPLFDLWGWQRIHASEMTEDMWNEPWYYPICLAGNRLDEYYTFRKRDLINAEVNLWSCEKNSRLFAGMSSQIIWKIKTTSGKLLLFVPQEGPQTDGEFVSRIHLDLVNQGISPSKLILASGDYNGQKLNHRDNRNTIRNVYVPYYEAETSRRAYRTFSPVQSEPLNPRLFLYMMGKPRLHRVLFLMMLVDRDPNILRDYAYYSADAMSGQFLNELRSDEKHSGRAHSMRSVLHYLDSKYPTFAQDWTPKSLDIGITEERPAYQNNNYQVPDDFFTNTVFSVVTETMMDEAGLFVSEKTYKAIYGGHPVFFIGGRGFYEMMAERGYLLDDFQQFGLNNNIKDVTERLINAVDTLAKLSRGPSLWITQKWLDMRKEYTNHNQMLLFNRKTSTMIKVGQLLEDLASRV